MNKSLRLGSEPAYPQGTSDFRQVGEVSKAIARIEGGLSKRELFAAMALQGMVASDIGQQSRANYAAFAGDAVAFADALLEELAK